jgi:hypothetical protein
MNDTAQSLIEYCRENSRVCSKGVEKVAAAPSLYWRNLRIIP